MNVHPVEGFCVAENIKVESVKDYFKEQFTNYYRTNYYYFFFV